MPTEDPEREVTVADVKAWREGPWVLIAIAGEIVLRRLTRDPAFTHAVAIFNEGSSPAYPKNRQHFVRAELTGAWQRGRYRGPSGPNRIQVPIASKENPYHD